VVVAGEVVVVVVILLLVVVLVAIELPMNVCFQSVYAEIYGWHVPLKEVYG
jgi:hypothetical protein